MVKLLAKNVICDIAKDFESFFIIDYKVKLDFGNYGNLSIKGTGDKTRIKIPNEFSNMEVNSDEDLVFIVLLMGHELAHHINKHNSLITNTSEEHKAIETWADYFGISISLTILLYNTKFRQYLKNSYTSNDEHIKLVLRVFERLYLNVYKNNGTKYESAEYRLNTVFVGIVSWIAKVEITRNFLTGSQKDPEVIYRDYAFHWHLRLVELISENKNSIIYNVLIYMKTLGSVDDMANKAQLIHNLHKKISNGRYSITYGIKLDLLEILNTSFGKNPRQGKLLELLDELGIDYKIND